MAILDRKHKQSEPHLEGQNSHRSDWSLGLEGFRNMCGHPGHDIMKAPLRFKRLRTSGRSSFTNDSSHCQSALSA